MAKIADVIKLKSGYANFVELKSAFEEMQENADRMAMYRPTKAHRAAFEKVCRGLSLPNDKKFYLISGSYGTGKSHLCLMLANFLSRSSGDPEIKGFYENYENLNPDKAKELKNIRKSGQFLVAICDYHSGKKFEDVVLSAVFEACKAKGLDVEVETQFDEAERLLAGWEEKSGKVSGKDNYKDFQNALSQIAPALSVDQLRTNLKSIDSDALATFQQAFQEMMGGMEFQSQSGNLIPILKKLVKSKSFKDRFKGLALFYDEFGFTLEKASFSKDVLQGFMETICKNEPNVMFIGCIHKDFKAYADRYSKDDASVMAARTTPVDLLNEGIEEIIAAIVETDKTSDLWRNEVAPKTGIFDTLVPYCKTLKLFPWIKDVDTIRQRVLEDIYGVHPMALSCLLRLSSEIGSDARSTFTFFSGDVGGAEGSYADFIKDADFTSSGGKLNLFTVDNLFLFFNRELSRKNQELRDHQRKLVNGFYASRETAQKSSEKDLFDDAIKEREKILKTILIYHLCQIPTNTENVEFGLYCLTNPEKKRLAKHLNFLKKSGALFYREQSKTWELSVGGGEDPYDLITRYMDDSGLHPTNRLDAFLTEAGNAKELEFLDAKQFNLPFNDDKRFKRTFVEAKDLGTKLWEKVNDEWASNLKTPNKSYEGTVVYVMSEDDAQIQIAKNAVSDIPYSNIAVAVLKKTKPYEDTLLRVKACKHYLPPNEAEKISAETESRLREILEGVDEGYLPKLQKILREILSGEDACWYGEGGSILVDSPKQPHKPADKLCEDLFSKRCKIQHPDLNLVHDEKCYKGKNNALKQAIKILLEADSVYIDNGNPDSHGEKRYLEKILLKRAGGLKLIKPEPPISYFDCESDPANISDDFPVLKELMQQLSTLKPGEQLSLGVFLEKVKPAPYGATGNMLVLALAHAVRAYGERLITYKDSTKTTPYPFDTYEDLANIVSDSAPKIVFEVREISPEQKQLIEGIAKGVHAPAIKFGESRSLDATYGELSKWWKDLPEASKIINLYQKENHARLKKLIQTLTDTSSDKFILLLENIPSVYTEILAGESLSKKEVDQICDQFTDDVKSLESGYSKLKTSVFGSICKLFDKEGDIVVCEKVVTEWYQNLSASQRDPYKCGHEDAQSLINLMNKTDITFEEKFMRWLPEDYAFEKVKDWTADHTDAFTAKIKQAKEEIDKAKPEVPQPVIEKISWTIDKGDSVTVGISKNTTGIIYTVSADDPKKAKDTVRVDKDFDIAKLLGDKSKVTVSMCSVDENGNFSEVKKIELVNKSKEFEIELSKDLFKNETGKFRFPKNKSGLVAVVRSLLNHAVKRKIIDQSSSEKIRKNVGEQLTKD